MTRHRTPSHARAPRTATAALALSLAFTAVLAAPTAHATVVLELPRADLVQRSELVVRATVAEQHTQWNEDQTAILTITHLRVTRYLKGAGPADLYLRQMGGTLDGYVSHVEGDPELATGQDVVVFLHDRGTGNVYLTALAQALYRVEHTPGRDPVVRRDLEGLTFAHRVQGQMVLAPPAAEAPETLQHLIDEVISLARGGR